MRSRLDQPTVVLVCDLCCVPSQPSKALINANVLCMSCTRLHPQSSITFQWVAPPSNGAAVSNYTLERDEGGTLAAQMNGLVQNSYMRAYAGPLQTVMVGGLKSGMHYRFRLRAENDVSDESQHGPLHSTVRLTAT